jgi:hypothetical protein
MKESINDWSEYLLWAEKNFKELEDKLLHHQLDGWEENINAIQHAMFETVAWINANAKQK